MIDRPASCVPRCGAGGGTRLLGSVSTDGTTAGGSWLARSECRSPRWKITDDMDELPAFMTSPPALTGARFVPGIGLTLMLAGVRGTCTRTCTASKCDCGTGWDASAPWIGVMCACCVSASEWTRLIPAPTEPGAARPM
ncbi:hypothetical protein GCM10010381_68340 [Streptomyces xantholiticus]|nr:hypothetical protein GCM10010381_68340 [Streptomyces xantholiticus]